MCSIEYIKLDGMKAYKCTHSATIEACEKRMIDGGYKLVSGYQSVTFFVYGCRQHAWYIKFKK